MALGNRKVKYVKENCDMKKLSMNGKLRKNDRLEMFLMPILKLLCYMEYRATENLWERNGSGKKCLNYHSSLIYQAFTNFGIDKLQSKLLGTQCFNQLR